jgi:hypothetical protein
MTRLYRVAAAAALATVFLGACLCFSPVRWDRKALRASWLDPVDRSLPQGTNLLYVSSDDSWPHGHVAAYGLDLTTFPDGRKAWLVFAEGNSEGPWKADVLVDPSGVFFVRAGRRGWLSVSAAPEPVRTIATTGVVLVASTDVRDQLLVRWPGLDPTRISVLSSGRAPLFEGPAARVGFGLLLRLFLASFVVFALAVTLWRAPAAWPSLRAFHVGLGLALLVTIHASLVFFLGRVTRNATGLTLAVEAAALAMALTRIGQRGTTHLLAPAPPLRRPRRVRSVVALLAMLYAAGFVLRLDFDGDLLTHWIPMARSHHLLGRHDVGSLIARYGVAHQVTYPPGFPILISTLLWVSGADRAASFTPGSATHALVFLYRLASAGFSFAFLAGLGSVFRAIRSERGLAWLIPPATSALLLPLFLGKPTSGEVVFVPIVGFAMVAFLAGHAFRRVAYTRAGLALAVLSLFFKNDAMLILPLVVLPWYLASGPRFRAARWEAAVVLAAALPVVLWRLEILGLGVRSNFMFDPVSWTRLRTGLDVLPIIAANAAKILLASNFWVAFALALPPAALWDIRQRRNVWLAVPFGTALYVPLAAGIYVFSRSDPVFHMDTSYERLLMTAVLGAVLYAASSALREGQRCGSEHAASPAADLGLSRGRE